MINDVKSDYKGYKFFLTGSIARKESNPNDIDINIIPPNENRKEWSKVLNRFEGRYIEGKRFDAQIIPKLKSVLNGYKGILAKYIIKNNKLSEKTSFVANEKARLRGVDKLPFMYMEI